MKPARLALALVPLAAVLPPAAAGPAPVALPFQDDDEKVDKRPELKELLETFGVLGATEEELWAIQRPLQEKVFDSDDAREGPRAFAEKRPPEWSGT